MIQRAVFYDAETDVTPRMNDGNDPKASWFPLIAANGIIRMELGIRGKPAQSEVVDKDDGI